MHSKNVFFCFYFAWTRCWITYKFLIVQPEIYARAWVYIYLPLVQHRRNDSETNCIVISSIKSYLPEIALDFCTWNDDKFLQTKSCSFSMHLNLFAFMQLQKWKLNAKIFFCLSHIQFATKYSLSRLNYANIVAINESRLWKHGSTVKIIFQSRHLHTNAFPLVIMCKIQNKLNHRRVNL